MTTKTRAPNHPAPGEAAFGALSAFACPWRGVPEPGC